MINRFLFFLVVASYILDIAMDEIVFQDFLGTSKLLDI
jgi:hypothetical protein